MVQLKEMQEQANGIFGKVSEGEKSCFDFAFTEY